MTQYRRAPAAIHAALTTTRDGQIITQVPCMIQIPVRFSDQQLASIGEQTFIYGCYALILPDTMEYALCNVCSMMEISPTRMSVVTIDGAEYYEFWFDARTVVIRQTTVVRRDAIIFNILDELVFKGKVPWYVGYEDLGQIFNTAKDYANSNVGQNYETVEFIASLVTRSRQDRMQMVRQIANRYADVDATQIDYVPLKSVYYSVNSTINKLSGSYFSDGINSALINPTTRVDTVEQILRS